MPAARFPGLKVTTPAFQAGNVGFKSHRSYCGHRIMVIRQIVILLMLMGGSIPPGHPMDGYA